MRVNNYNRKQKIKNKPVKAAVKERPAGLILAGDEIVAPKHVKSYKKTSRIIAFICGRIGSTFVTSVVRGTEERVRAFGEGAYELHHYPSAGRKTGAGDAVREIITGKKADGIIILSVMPDAETMELIKKSPMPVVFIERQVQGAYSVTIDNYAGGFSAAMHFINNNRVKPGIILDPQSVEKGTASNERLSGFKDAMKKAGIKPDPKNFTWIDFHTIEQGREAFEKIQKRIKNIDSMFSAAGDMAAIGFMLEARSSGIRIPEDLAIIGFDDIEMASAVTPLLTTVRQPINEMGGKAMEIIHGHLNGNRNAQKQVVLESRLIVRESA